MAVEVVSRGPGGLCLLGVAGTLDVDQAEKLWAELQQLREPCRHHFVLDLSQLTKIEFPGLRELFVIAKRLELGEGSLYLCGLRPELQRYFDQAPRLFSIHKSCEELQQAARIAQVAGSLLDLEIPWQSGPDSAEPDERRLELAVRILGRLPEDDAGED